jgi:DNA-binding transcriptional MerR regulator
MQKLYYSISEVSEMIDEEQHILRYWEKEFEQLNPKKNRAGNRIYSEKDISIIKIIKKLLREEKLSLKGAKENLSRINLGAFEDNLFSFSNEIDNSISQEFMNIHDIPSDSVIMKKQQLQEVRSLLIDIKRFLVEMKL